SFAHLLELPNKISLERDAYSVVGVLARDRRGAEHGRAARASRLCARLTLRPARHGGTSGALSESARLLRATRAAKARAPRRRRCRRLPGSLPPPAKGRAAPTRPAAARPAAAGPAANRPVRRGAVPQLP